MGRLRALGALSGLLAALTALAVAEVCAALMSAPAPVFGVGTWAIDTSPGWLRDWAIDTFGFHDKKVLVAGVVTVVAVLGALTGALGVTRRRVALALAVATGVVGVLAVATVRGADDPMLVRVTPAAVALVVGTAGLAWLLASMQPGARIERVHPAGAATPARAIAIDRPTGPAEAVQPPLEKPAVIIPARNSRALAPELNRRGFVRAAGAVGLVGLTGGALWQAQDDSYATTGLVRLPRPASRAPSVRGADFGMPGLRPYFTPNTDFYRVDTALDVPRLDPDSWRLRIHGMVENPVTLTFDDLLSADLIERDVTLVCVSNPVGDSLNSNARWLGVRIADVLRSVGVQAGADAVKSTSSDGWTCGTPLSALTDPKRDAMFAVGMNGEALPANHGFPVRMVVPGLYGYVSATKWIVDFEVTRFDQFRAYWTDRSWAEQAPIKTQSRFEIPVTQAELAVGRQVLAGQAWAPHTGVDKVEVLLDDGAVLTAELAPWNNVDTWRQWRIPNWDAAPVTRPAGSPEGLTFLKVRATDASGYTQTAEVTGSVPDGATGWHTLTVYLL